MFSQIELNNIKKIYENINNDSEFEIMFYNYKPDNKLSIIKFIDLLYYIKYRSNKENLELILDTSLDISYSYSNLSNYRISIKGKDKINKILNLVHQRKNHIIISLLVNQFYDNEDFEFIVKSKDINNILDIDNYDIRFRLSSEIPMEKNELDLLKNLKYTESDKIFFRYKQRISLILFDNEKQGKLKVDLTIIKFSNNPDKLHDVNKQFEIELEYIKGKDKLNDAILTKIIDEINIIKKIFEKSNIIINKNDANIVVNNYIKLLFNSNNNITNLYSMKPISTEVQHIVDKLPNKYSITDKADGEYYQLYVDNDIVYLISNNLIVKKTNYTVKNMNNTVIEGELFHIKKYNIYLFMMFDCLFFKNNDVRNENMLINRLKNLHEFTDNMNIKEYIIKEYEGVFNLSDQEKYYENEIYKFYNNLNKLIEKSKENDIIFHSKLFLFPTGANNCEVYSLSYLIWDLCKHNNKIKCPYILDGIIYTAIDQKYTRDKREQKYPTYKYKPPTTNSIDVYLTFQKNYETGEFLEIYDNSISNNIEKNKVFRIANLNVGESINDKEIYVPFLKEENNHEAYFPVENNQVRDIEGILVNDNSVIEIIYTNDQSIPHQYRWKILRTRWDKTESVLLNNKQYGNFKDVAIKIWKSIRESITIEEIKKLAKIETYNKQLQILSLRIDSQVISSERAQDLYYQKITNLGQTFRAFINWIKSNIIYTYCDTFSKNKKSVLDIGCGRGGDILKFYHSKIEEYVGVDIHYEDLFGSIDSAIVRYNKNINLFPNFPKMIFIQADCKLLLDIENQEKELGNMKMENKNLITQVFTKNKKFDVINFSFSIHYLFDNKSSVNNLITNIKNYLAKDGYVLCTLFDPTLVLNLLNGQDSFISWYTDDEGQRKKFFEIIKKFNNELKDEPGLAIDVYMAWINADNTYETEYLITQKLLIKTLEKTGCVLVDTDSFFNIYNLNKDWFLNVINHEENPKNKKFYKNVAKFYENLKGVDKESKTWTDLFRYYIFKKI